MQYVEYYAVSIISYILRIDYVSKIVSMFMCRTSSSPIAPVPENWTVNPEGGGPRHLTFIPLPFPGI